METTDFSFPFTPYPMQNDLMRALFSCLRDACHGVFESPTGTGKSLTLICGSLTWLAHEQARLITDLELEINRLTSEACKIPDENCLADGSDDEPAWMRDFDRVQHVNRQLDDAKSQLETIQHFLTQLEEFKAIKSKSSRMDHEHVRSEYDVYDFGEIFPPKDDGDADIVLDEYQSDQELSATSDSEDRNETDGGDEIIRPLPQILFASRTHSQLAQFIKEMSRTKFASDVTAVAVASRASMCVNEHVSRLKFNPELVNEACLEIINKKTKKSENSRVDEEPAKKKRKNKGLGPKTCAFYNQAKIKNLKQHLLTRVSDIEDAVKLGQEFQACPYYATRFALKSTHLVALPYQSLLHKTTRESMGIDLKESVVLLDEAHNLLETLSAMHSVELNGSDFCQVYSQLNQYLKRFKSRLKTKNILYIRQLLLALRFLILALGGNVNSNPDGVKNIECNELLQIDDFSHKYELDNVNLFKLLSYIEKSEICRKLIGFAEKYPSGESPYNIETPVNKTSLSAVENFFAERKSPTAKANESAISSENKNPNVSKITENEHRASRSKMYSVRNLFRCLTSELSLEPRVMVRRTGIVATSTIKVFILNPSSFFQQLVNECRSIILIGGTMQPLSEFTEQLLGAVGVPKTKIRTFACGHIVKSSQIRVYIVPCGPTGKQLQFSYVNRGDPTLMSELGESLFEVVSRVKGGCVVFFPSYDIEKTAVNAFTQSGVIKKIERSGRSVYREPKTAAECESTFTRYKSSCDEGPTGALLFAIMGGKMSEGINFSDHYGRCVIVVGMPYPNIKSPQLQEKMKYLNGIKPGLGQEYYENTCMKSVNQSIGRAIRHKSDYASVVLLDSRYCRQNVKDKLPKWMAESVTQCNEFSMLNSALTNFFSDPVN